MGRIDIGSDPATVTNGATTMSLKFRIFARTTTRAISSIQLRTYLDPLTSNYNSLVAWTQSDYLSGITQSRIIVHKVCIFRFLESSEKS
jgi:hypothetical protein